jgi:predicted deacylase
VRPGGDDDGFTVLELAGDADGPTVSAVGGVHGDEFEGVVACLRLAEVLTEVPVRGRLRLVPVAHEAAHRASARSSPVDGLNLARSFPGDPDGQPTERLADALRREIIEGADLFVDLHSAGTAYAMPLLVGWTDDGCATCTAGARAAEAFAMPVLWRHLGAVPPGRTLSAAHAAGIPSIYAEAEGGGTVTPAHADAYVAGMLRLLASVGVIEAAVAGAVAPGASAEASGPAAAAPRAADPPRRLVGEGNLDVPAMVAPFDGVCEVFVRPLDTVAAGQLVATVVDPLSGESVDVRAMASGVVVLARRGARVARAENLVVLAEPDEGGS